MAGDDPGPERLVRRAAFLLRLLGFFLSAAPLSERSDMLPKAAKDVTRDYRRAIADDHPR